MSALSVAFALAFYAATAAALYGLYSKLRQYWRTPAPLKIPTTPAPVTRRGVVMRLLREAVLFQSLFKASKWTWLFGWPFHAALLVLVLGHLRFVSEPAWGVARLAEPFASYAGVVLVLGLAGLWIRRIGVDRVRYISVPSDHLMLALLVALGASGLAMRHVAPTDIVSFKAFVLGLVRFDWQPLPGDAVLLIHLTLALALIAVFPFSKLLHAPGLFFSPSRNQADDARERRHAPVMSRQGRS